MPPIRCHVFCDTADCPLFDPQFDLVCSDEWLIDMFQAMLNIGFLLGSIAIGYLADR